MSSSIRLYERLDQIPQDPNDPESLDDLIVCAFGAFERYYVCWKNKAGEYRQDGYDLPPALQEWLWPRDKTTRDFATLQVVFGRGDEYFASDKNGKLEYKEPEKKATETVEEKPALRRTRTMSAFRGAPDAAAKPLPSVPDDSSSSRRLSGASQTASRPPSMSFSARSMSDASFISHPNSRSPSISSMLSTADTMTTVSSRPPSDADLKPLEPKTAISPEEYRPDTTINTPLRLKRKSRPLSMSFKPSSYPRISEGKQLPSEPTPSLSTPQALRPPTQTTFSTHCTCGCHTDPQHTISRPTPSTYADASVQTSPPVSPLRTALPIDHFYGNYASPAQDTRESEEEFYDAPAVNPFPMGSMMAFFSKPGYQLGDSLRRHYDDEYDQPHYDYQDQYEQTYVESYDDDWAAWEAANGRG